MSLFDSMKARYLLILLVFAVISGCVKGPTYPIVPAIEFKSVSANNYHILYTSADVIDYPKDTIIITFTDGDGDIGPTNNGIDSCNFCGLKNGDTTCLNLRNVNVFMIDSRDSCLVTNRTADVEPIATSYKAISGQILVVVALDMKRADCFTPTPSCSPDTLSYSIFIKDKAGHYSNVVKTSKITIDVVQQ